MVSAFEGCTTCEEQAVESLASILADCETTETNMGSTVSIWKEQTSVCVSSTLFSLDSCVRVPQRHNKLNTQHIDLQIEANPHYKCIGNLAIICLADIYSPYALLQVSVGEYLCILCQLSTSPELQQPAGPANKRGHVAGPEPQKTQRDELSKPTPRLPPTANHPDLLRASQYSQ